MWPLKFCFLKFCLLIFVIFIFKLGMHGRGICWGTQENGDNGFRSTLRFLNLVYYYNLNF
jgi:hypothetical protein